MNRVAPSSSTSYLDKESIHNMALTGKIFIEEKDILYIRGEHKKAIKIAQVLKKEGWSNELIAKTTELSIEEIQQL